MLVEVNVSQPLVISTKLKTSSNVITEQKLEFEWVPIFCQRCQLVGHKCTDRNAPVPPQRQPRRRSQNRVQTDWVQVGNRNRPAAPVPVEPPAPIQQNQFAVLNYIDHGAAVKNNIRFGSVNVGQHDPGPSLIVP